MHKLLLAAFALVAAGLVGCSSQTKADTSALSMTQTSAQLDKGTAQINSVMASLDTLVVNKNNDLKPFVKKYSAEVDKTEDVAAQARTQAAAMKARAKEQFDAWVADSQKISDPSLQKANLERRDQAKTAFANVTDEAQKVKAAYEPFIGNLKDIRTFLGTDTTSHGVDAMADTIKKAHVNADKLKSEIASMQKAIAEVKDQLVSKR
jgi:hypothetical protein